MTSRERVLAALGGKTQARPPFTLTLSLYGARLTGCPLNEYYRVPARFAEGQQAVSELCGPDILFGPFALPLEAAAFGSETVFLPDSPPNVRKPAFRDPGEFLRQELPDPDSNPHLTFFREAIRSMASRTRGQVPICGVVTAPVDLPALILGLDLWIETLLFAPATAEAILEATGRHFIRFANALLADGADFIGLTTVLSNPRILFRDQIARQILPALTRHFREVKGPIVFHHGGNPMVPFLEGYLSLPNVAAFTVDYRDSLPEARRILGPGRLLLGNLNGPVLSRMPVGAAVEKVQRILEDRKGDPCFLFASSGADVAFDTPPELLLAIAETIRGFGGEVPPS